MAQAHAAGQTTSVAAAAASQDRKRVKVYELKNNDWYDRGTGFCTGQHFDTPGASPENPDARIIVISEDEPQRTLLETRITKDDGYQKQQETLIVWTETNGVDMALSFQEAEGCAHIWDFVSEIQNSIPPVAPGDDLSDDLLDPLGTLSLPDPEIGRLDETEAAIRNACSSPAGRDALAKFVMHPDHMYILKLVPLVERAEELHSVADLHRLCTIMKHIILLNDTAIIEFIATDEAVMGVVGALEYDPDFPSHRANHRQWLSDASRFKEVVPIEDPNIKRKIHWTYRLLYLKDVVLARILDDPTFSVLNSLIYYHQVEIINHLQCNQEWMKALFEIFTAPPNELVVKKKEAVLFIQNCCAVSKNIQAMNRAQLYQNFIDYGLFEVITFALQHADAAVRVAGTDILVALIDHDPHMVRNHVFSAIKDGQVPLTDTLISLLLVEVDLGVKSQMADAIKILLDPTSNQIGLEMAQRGEGAPQAGAGKQNGGSPGQQTLAKNGNMQANGFIEKFYDSSAKRLFTPLRALEHRQSMAGLTIQELSLYTHLVDVLCFFARQHLHRSKTFILSEGLHTCVAQLLSCPQKYMKLNALKWFRTCIGLQDEWHNRQIIAHELFDPILEIVEETMPRDNLLNSACLELFEYIKREGIKALIVHLVPTYRDRLMRIGYVPTFKALVHKYDQLMAGYPITNGAEDSSFTTQEGTPQRMINGRQSFAGLKEMDGDEEAYFNADDEVDEDEGLPTLATKPPLSNGASPARPLVPYGDDDDADEGMDLLASSPDPGRERKPLSSSSEEQVSTDPVDAGSTEPMAEDTPSPTGDIDEESPRGRNRTPVALQGSPGAQLTPPEPLAAKRRREEDDDEDELGKMMGGVKRRNSSASISSRTAGLHVNAGAVGSPKAADSENTENGGPLFQPEEERTPTHSHAQGMGPSLRRKGSLRTKNETPGRFAIKIGNLKERAEGRRQSHSQEQQGGAVGGDGGDEGGGAEKEG